MYVVVMEGATAVLPFILSVPCAAYIGADPVRLPPDSWHSVTCEQPYCKFEDSGTTRDEGLAVNAGLLQDA